MYNMVVFMKMLNKKRIKKIFKKKFVKYVVVASVTTVINILVYLLSYHLICKNILFSNILAYACSISLSFVMNEKIVYKCNSRKYKKQIPLYMISKLISFILDSLVLYGIDRFLNISSFMEKVIANASTGIFNYFVLDKIIFKNNE